MIKTYIKSNFLNEEKIYAETTTILSILSENNMSLVGNAMTTVNGIIINEGNKDKPLSEFAVDNCVTIMSIIKGDGNK